MSQVFVSTNYWVAAINPQDQWHERAKEVRQGLSADVGLVTSEPVLVEVLNYFSAYRAEVRESAADAVRRIIVNPAIEVVAHTHDAFLDGLSLYEARLDKGYSLTDCISMNIMREYGITEALTHDKHFVQEGFTILL
jgi:predicted nucleic acid-binding protein